MMKRELKAEFRALCQRHERIHLRLMQLYDDGEDDWITFPPDWATDPLALADLELLNREQAAILDRVEAIFAELKRLRR